MNLTRINEIQAGGFWPWNILGGAGLKTLPLALVMLPMGVIFFISALAETNRPPFDLPEAESELVTRFMVEYGSSPYMMFMLGEYAAVVLMCSLTTILFLGGWLPPLDIWILNWVPGIIWFLLKSCL